MLPVRKENKLFGEMCSDPNHKLRELVPELNKTKISVRNKHMFNLLKKQT